VLCKTQDLLVTNGAGKFEDMMEFARGAYLFRDERHPRAVYIKDDVLLEERDGETAEPPSCRFQHGAILPSSTSAQLDLLTLVDLNCSAFRTELWLPWLYCDHRLVTEAGFAPSQRGGSQGSLYVGSAESGMRAILDRLRYVERYINPQSAESNSSSTQKIVIPRGHMGDGESSLRYVVNLRPYEYSRVKSVKPWTGKVLASDATDDSGRVAATQKQKLAYAS